MILSSWLERVDAAVEGARQTWKQLTTDPNTHALAHFLHPQLPGDLPLRELWQPAVAAVAVSIVGTAFGVGAGAFVLMLICAAVIYAIVTGVFGIELDVAIPR